jgi:hypothetical protein
LLVRDLAGSAATNSMLNLNVWPFMILQGASAQLGTVTFDGIGAPFSPVI